MDLETACRDLKELGVIDEKMIYNAIIEQGPKGEEGRLFKQQGINYEEITCLRLEYLSILKIDHLWICTGLTKLQLCNNVIEKIENIEFLVNLKELDLSFNNIEKIENLETLKNLEVLTFYQNKIKKVENLEELVKLTIFSIGNNLIEDKSCVIYFRYFEKLRSFTLAGNPVCSETNFDKYVIAYLPQLTYYEYRMIREEEKKVAKELFRRDIKKLEREEAVVKKEKLLKIQEEEQEQLNAKAFVEYLGKDQLFMSMFEKDTDCKTLLFIGDTVKDLYNEYKKNFCAVTEEIHMFGLKQLELRKAETERFEKFTKAANQKLYEESRRIAEEFLDQKKLVFGQVKELLHTEVEDEEAANEISFNLQCINDNFKEYCSKTWTDLMRKELYLHETNEENNGIYERTLVELVNQFIEGCQAQFTLIRQLQNNFNESLADAANKFFTNYTVTAATGRGNEFKNLPPELLALIHDKDTLVNAISASHDYHLLIIDQREDKLITGIKTWLSEVVDNLVNNEIKRSRSTITEINHFLDTQKAELQELLSTPVGLLLLPKEVQDVLQL